MHRLRRHTRTLCQACACGSSRGRIAGPREENARLWDRPKHDEPAWGRHRQCTRQSPPMAVHAVQSGGASHSPNFPGLAGSQPKFHQGRRSRAAAGELGFHD